MTFDYGKHFGEMRVLHDLMTTPDERTYKKYRLWKDPERVLADMTPCQQASGVDPDRAREVVARVFPG